MLWSPKAACTAAYVWLANVCGFLDEVRRFESPHHHRMQVYRTSHRYLDSIAGDTSGFQVVKIIRDPYERAVSIFREAFVGNYADRDAALAGLNFDAGVSFHAFLLMIERLDMQNVDTHYRPQFHPFERKRRPDTTINVSKTNLFAELNGFDTRRG